MADQSGRFYTHFDNCVLFFAILSGKVVLSRGTGKFVFQVLQNNVFMTSAT